MATDRSMLFSWDDVERLPELRRLEFVLDNLPDAAVVGALEARRGRGRDEVPTAWAFSRFVAGVAKLEDEVGAVSGMVAALRRRLMDELPGFGRHLGTTARRWTATRRGGRRRRRGSPRTRTRTGGSTRRTAWTRRRAGRGRR